MMPGVVSRKPAGRKKSRRGEGLALPFDPHPVAQDEPEFHFHLDRPQVVHDAAVETVVGQFILEGWVLSRSGIAGIEVRLDDVPVGEAQYGLAREDVGLAFPDWDLAPRSGYAFHFLPGALPQGHHLVKLIVRARNGEESAKHFRIDVQNSGNAADVLGVYPSPDNGSSRYDQVLPILLPTLIDQVYRTVLCRPADADGLGHYGSLLATGRIDLRCLIDAIYGSQEFTTIVDPAAKIVQEAFIHLFGREPSQAERYNHIQVFRDSCTSDDEALALLGPSGGAQSRLGIRPIKIEMDITNQCNIRCVMCPFSDPAVGSRKRRDLDMPTFQRWAGEMFSWAAQVGLMFGTEPTLNSNLLPFVKIAKAFRVPNVYFSTNGMKLTPALAEGLIEAGLDEINVSLDAGTKETFQRIRRGAKWDVVIRNLQSLRDKKAELNLTRPRLHMSFVMMRSNIEELPQFVEIAAELGAVVLYCTHLVSYDVLGTTTESLGTDLLDYAMYIDRAQILARQYGIQIVLPRTRQARVDLTLSTVSSRKDGVNHLAHIDQAREAHGLAKRFARDEANSCCPFPWHFIAIEPDGSVSPCGWWHAGPPMGNLHTQSFQEIWWGKPMQGLRTQLVNRNLGTNCSRCPAAGVGSSDSPGAFQSR